MCRALMRLRRIRKAVTVHGFRGSGFNENPPAIRRAGLKSPTSKINERPVCVQRTGRKITLNPPEAGKP